MIVDDFTQGRFLIALVILLLRISVPVASFAETPPAPGAEMTAPSATDDPPTEPRTGDVPPENGPAQPPNSPFDPAQDPNLRLRLPVNAAEGLPIQQVFIHLGNPPGAETETQALRQQLADTFGVRAGGNFSPLLTDRGLNQVQRLPFVNTAEYRLYQSSLPGAIIVALLITLESPEEEPAPVSGWIGRGASQDFPILYEDDGSLVKIVMNGGLGFFSDSNPWFGNAADFVANSYRPTGTITWGESYLELGLAGIARLGQSSTYLYGEASYTVSDTVQPDIFRTDSRIYRDMEKLYGGVLIAPNNRPLSFNLSAGRQIFQLNQGFLFSQFAGSANALERGASYLNPRTTYDMTVLTNLEWENFRWQNFFLEPDELPISDTNTQFLGTSFSYNNNQGLEAVLTYVTVPSSDRFYVLPDGNRFSRQGLQVINPRLRYSSLLGVPGLWIEGEYAYQFSDRQAMTAQGAYVWLGYTANDWPWRPTFSYRFAGFSGDNPQTSAYERFDPLLASGLTDWLQGISLGKVYNNANSFTHRANIVVMPSSNLEFSLNYYYRYADTLNNLGGNPVLSSLQSRDIGQEILLIGRYYISENFLLQGVGSVAFPGGAIRQAVSSPTSAWTTLQVSLFMFF